MLLQQRDAGIMLCTDSSFMGLVAVQVGPSSATNFLFCLDMHDGNTQLAVVTVTTLDSRSRSRCAPLFCVALWSRYTNGAMGSLPVQDGATLVFRHVPSVAALSSPNASSWLGPGATLTVEVQVCGKQVLLAASE
jgi:hypothetical protein